MNFKHSAKFQNLSKTALRVVVEPWAVEFQLPAGESCEVVAISQTKQPQVNREDTEYGMIFFVEGEGAIYEYWQNGKLVD